MKKEKIHLAFCHPLGFGLLGSREKRVSDSPIRKSLVVVVV